MANTKEQIAAKEAADKAAAAKAAPTVADAKATPGVNAGSDEAGSLADVEEAQNGKATEEPAAAFSSGFDADTVAREQKAIRDEAERMASVNAEREKQARDDAKNAKDALSRVKRLEDRQDQLFAAVLALSDGRNINREALETAKNG